MASTGLKGPFPLTEEGIDDEVTRTSPGAYALGYLDDSNTFIVCYVGRSDDDLNGRLKNWVGKKNYKRFKYDYFASPKDFTNNANRISKEVLKFIHSDSTDAN